MKTLHLLGAVDLPARTSSVPLARAFVRGLLATAGRTEPDHAELLVSEVLANAVRYSDSRTCLGGTVRMVVTDNGRALRVEVIDDGSAGAVPHIPAQVDPLSESGRGLWLVRELSSAWGCDEGAPGRVVWFEIAG